jgi:hypothetical protein
VAERNRLRDEQAQLVCASLELEDRGRPVEVGARPAAPSVAPTSVPAVEPAPRPTALQAHAREMKALQELEQASDDDWWTKQLGSPLEAA